MLLSLMQPQLSGMTLISGNLICSLKIVNSNLHPGSFECHSLVFQKDGLIHVFTSTVDTKWKIIGYLNPTSTGGGGGGGCFHVKPVQYLRTPKRQKP